MKILLFMDVYIFGGCEKMLKEMSEYLLSKGYNVDLLLIYKSEDNTYLDALDPRIQIRYIWHVDKKPNYLKRFVYWINVLFPKIAVSRIDMDGYDMLINFKDEYQTNIIASKIKCRKIAWVHNITEDYHRITKKGLKYRIADVFYKGVNNKYLRTFSMFNRVVFVSEHAKMALEKRCVKAINGTVIYNYTDIPSINKMSEETITDYKFNKFTFCYVGRLSAEKGVVEIVENVCKLINNGYDVNLIVIGEGYQLEKLKEITLKKNCQSNIIFLGTKKNPYPYIRHSDVILCASYKESFGLVVLESIILKKWIISTRCGGPEELIEDGVNGYLVDDHSTLYEKMKTVYENNNIVRESTVMDYKNLQNLFSQKLSLLINDGKER